MSTKYKNLVFEGNGMNGLAYIGALKVLEDKNIVENLECFAGTSSGAIMASLISIGYTSEELLNLCNEISWKKIVQKRNCLFQFIHFWKRYGLFKYNQIETTIKSFFLRKLGVSDLTFQEHYQLTGKKLILVGVNINKKQTEYFCNQTTPDMSVITAIKISTSFPFVFDPIKYNDMLYVDGGVMNNFPIEYFGNNPTETLGINLIDKNFNNPNNENVDNILKYGLNILQSIILVQNHCDLKYITDNVITIEISNANFINSILLMNQNVNNLYSQGVLSSLSFFEK